MTLMVTLEMITVMVIQMTMRVMVMTMRALAPTLIRLVERQTLPPPESQMEV